MKRHSLGLLAMMGILLVPSLASADGDANYGQLGLILGYGW